MKIFSFLFFSPFLLASPAAETPRPPADFLSLATVTARVLARNPTLREAQARWEAARERIPQAAAWEDVKLSANTRAGRFITISPNGFTDQMLSLEQVIPISGKNLSQQRVAVAEMLAAAEDFRRSKLEAIEKARAAYFQWSKTGALLAFNQEAETSLQQASEISRDRLATGGQAQVETLAAENERARIEEAQRDLEQTSTEAETQLKTLMNLDPFSPIGQPVDPLVNGAKAALPAEKLRDLLFTNRPEIRKAEAELGAARARLELAKRNWIPDPALTVQAQRYNGAAQAISEVDVGLSFNLPWLNGGKYRATEKEAARAVEAAQARVEAARQEALGLLRDQLRKIQTLHHHVELYDRELIPTARRIVETNRANYQSGRTTFLDLLGSQRGVWDLEASQRQHRADYQTALADLEAIVGTDLQFFPAANSAPRP